MNSIKIIHLFIFLSFLNFSCNSQPTDNKSLLKNREALFAGRFYASGKQELLGTLKNLFASAKPKIIANEHEALAVIAPHAGYVYSGNVAASSFNQLNANKKYENIFVIGSSHRVAFQGASIYNKGHYETPLGTVEVNLELANKIIKDNKVFTYYPAAHSAEHSLEVELPFLQYHLKNDFKIVPIIIGSQNQAEKIADALKPYFTSSNLFVISSDFSHYPTYNDAIKVDRTTMQAICSNSPQKLIQALDANVAQNIPNLATSLCGSSAVLSLLHITKDQSDIKIQPIHYTNSGEAAAGSKDRVVGYYSIVFTKKKRIKMTENTFTLNEKDKKNLLNVARSTLNQYIAKGKIPDIDTAGFSDALNTHCGAFVTLHKNKRLRGCIGRFEANEPLYSIVQQMAIASSTQDSRFPAVTEDELEDIEIEISVLTPLKKVDSANDVILGKHGIYIRKGFMSGTFLPQVATETGWSKEEFLGHCSRDKAGLGWDGWKDADLYVYEAIIFHEE